MLKAFSRRFSGSGVADRQQRVVEEVHAFVMDLNKPMGITAKDKTLLITKVERRSFADAGGVVPGDRVSSVGGIDVYTIADLKAALTECRDRGDREVVICCEVGASPLTSKEVRMKKAKASKLNGRRSSWGGILLPIQPSSRANFAATLKLAEGGDAAAQHTVGVAYHKGLAPLGTPENEGEASSSATAMAVHWWTKAAAQNYAPSQVSLGTAHYTCRGTGHGEPNYDEAVRLWQKAAASESPDALVNLACMYLEGRCVPRGGDTAVRLLEEAGTWGGLGDVTADLLLANLLEVGGAGVAKDMHRALQLYAKAAADGNPRAAESLERLRAHKPKQQGKAQNSSPLASLPLNTNTTKSSPVNGDNSGESPSTSAAAQPLILDVVEVADADEQEEEKRENDVTVPPQAPATAALPARKGGPLSTSELAAANAARAAAQRSAREKKERERLARLQQQGEKKAGSDNGEEGMARNEELHRFVSTAELKESVAEGLRSIVYMSPEVLFRSLLDGKKAKEVDAEQLATGLAKYTDFKLKGTDVCVVNVLREIAGQDVGFSSAGEDDTTTAVGSSPLAPNLDAPASTTTFTLADLKERWHVVAGGAPKALSTAQKRAKKAADEKASRDR